MTRVAFLGLGVMGGPMAGHLFKQGYNLHVWNRSKAGCERWLHHHPQLEPAVSCAAAVSGADVVFTCLGNDQDVQNVVTGAAGAITHMSRGSILVDHTTTSSVLARSLAAQCAEAGIDFIDAPVSGGERGAIEAKLTVMAGGSAAIFAKAEPIIKAYAKQIMLIGDVGSGQLCKMVNQIAIAGVLQGLSEAIAFGEHANLDMAKVIAVISQGAAQSWQLDNRALTMTERKFDFGFAVKWMVKDLQYAIAQAEANNANLEITPAILDFYRQLADIGHSNSDTSALITRLDKK